MTKWLKPVIANIQSTRISQILDKPKHEALGYITVNPSLSLPLSIFSVFVQVIHTQKWACIMPT